MAAVDLDRFDIISRSTRAKDIAGDRCAAQAVVHVNGAAREVGIADIGARPGQNVRKRMLRVLFLRFRFRAEQADDQGDRLFARQRLFQLEALVCALKQAKGLQRFGLLQRCVAMAASGGQRRASAGERQISGAFAGGSLFQWGDRLNVSVQAGTLGREDQTGIFAGNADLADLIGGFHAGHVIVERVHDAGIAAAVTADQRAVDTAIGVDGLPPAALKVENADLVALKVEEHLALCAHDVGLSAVVVEAAHGERGCGFVVKLHVHDLMVDHVITRQRGHRRRTG